MLYKLESWRGLAAILVVIYHSPFSFSETPLPFISNSFLFVDFFFILSGMVMSLAYSKKIANGMHIKEYALLRFARIYPLHFFMLNAWLIYFIFKQTLFLNGLGGNDQFAPENHINLWTYTCNLLLIHAMGLYNEFSWNGPSWSISVEFFAYLFFYLSIVLFDKKQSILYPIIISSSCYLGLFLLDMDSLASYLSLSFIRCIGAFYIGVIIHRLKVKKILHSVPHINLFEVLSTLSLVILLCFSSSYIDQLCVVIIMALTIVIFSEEKNTGLLGAFFQTKLMRTLGLWSYSIYMIHSILYSMSLIFVDKVMGLEVTNISGIDSLLINLSILLITVYLSKYSYKYIEVICRDKIRSWATTK
ncbi:MAG: peptidoglycan/LPS O-acetylase OafA/YrhL [Alteromonadaceae bacterium]